jgi:apolipoprotein N-acyltransferase
MGSVAVERGVGAEGEVWRNGAFVVDPVDGLNIDGYAKRHLVPFGEYVPFRRVLGWLNKFVPIGDGDFEPGAHAAPLVVRAGGGVHALGALVCYEDIFPVLSRASVVAGADVLAVLTNNAWYGEGAAAYQHAAHSVLRAVETRRPVLRSGNGGWSGWIDEFGNIRAVLNKLPNGAITTRPKNSGVDTELADATIYFRGVATVDVTRDSRCVGAQSYYVRHGEWFVLVSLALAVFGGMVLATGRRSAEPETPNVD